MRILHAAIALSLAAGALARADVLTYGFRCITNNDPSSCAIGEAQLFVDVVGYGETVSIGSGNYGPASDDEVLFRFRNTGPLASVITGVYFDDGALLALASLIEMSGVDFVPGGAPPVLPGGGSLLPPFAVSFRATATRPRPAKGIGPGEALGVLFTLQTGKSWDDVIADLASRDLRIGLHVQAFPGGYSESFVNNGVVPEPAAILLVGSVLLVLGRRLRARRT